MIRTILFTILSVSPSMACFGGTNSLNCCNPTAQPCPSSIPPCAAPRYPFVAPPSTYAVAGGSYASPPAGGPSNVGPISGPTNGIYGSPADSYSSSHDAPIDVIASAQQQGAYNAGPVESISAPTSVPAPGFNNAPIVGNVQDQNQVGQQYSAPTNTYIAPAPVVETIHQQIQTGQQYSTPTETVHVQQQVQPHQYVPPVEAVEAKQQVHVELSSSYPAPQEAASVQAHVQTAQSNYQQATAEAGSYPTH